MLGVRRTWRRRSRTITDDNYRTTNDSEHPSFIQDDASEPSVVTAIVPGTEIIQSLETGDTMTFHGEIKEQAHKILSIKRFDNVASLLESDEVATLASNDPNFRIVISDPHTKEHLEKVFEECAKTQPVDGIYLIVAVRLPQ